MHTPTTFDHGQLNIPGRLAGLDAEIGRHVSTVAKQVKATDKARVTHLKADKAQAKALLAEMGADMAAKTAPILAGRLGISPAKAARDAAHELDQMAKWQPAKFMQLAERFKREANPK